MPIFELISSFNAGEVSPLIDARTALEKYQSSCRTLENFVILPYGGVLRRPGTEFVADIFDVSAEADTRSRLFSFNYSTTTRYVLQFGDGYLAVWIGGETPQNIDFFPVPYTADMLADLQIAQINDVVYIAHPSIPFSKLERFAPVEPLYPYGGFTYSEVEWTFPPMMEENADTTAKVTPSATTGTGINLVIDDPSGILIDRVYNNPDSFWQISHRRSSAFLEVSLVSTATGTSLQVLGDWELTTTGTWGGNLFLERSEDNGTTWETIRSWNSTVDRNYNSTGNQPFPALLRLRFAKTGSATNTGRATLTLSESRHVGLVKLNSYNPASQTANVDVILPLYSTEATHLWAEGAFSGFRGHPSAVTLHEQRLYLSGNTARRQTVWGSAIDDFENFRTGTNDDDSIQFTIAAVEQFTIEWMLSQNRLLIGTTGDEWTIEGSDTNKSITATNIKATRQSRYGSANTQALLLAEVVLFIQRNSRKVREFTFSLEKDGWVAVDLTLLAEHITRGGIKEVAYQQQPDSILWAVRNDGTLIGMTYERDQSVVGWHRHTTDGEFESVATIHGNGTEDEVWFVVKRTINGQEKRFIERFSLNWRSYLDDEANDRWWYLDCAKRFDPAETGDTLEVPHLTAKQVTIFSDGETVQTATATGGTVTLTDTDGVALVGLPYVSTLKPMKLDTQLQDGTAQGRKMRINGVIARVYKSRGGETQANDGTWRQFADDGSIFTGDHKITLAGKFAESADIVVRQTKPFPLSVIALIPKWDVYGAE